MKGFRFIKVVSGLVLALAGCVPDGGGQAVSRNPPRPLTLPERVAAHNAAVANTLLKQVASDCGGTTKQIAAKQSAELNRLEERKFPGTLTMGQWQRLHSRDAAVEKKALICRDKAFHQHVLIRMADLRDLAQATPVLRDAAKGTELSVAEPATFKAELASYKADLHWMVQMLNGDISGIERDKAQRHANFNSWMSAFSRAAANFNGQAAMSRTYGGAGTPTYGAPVIASYSQSVALAARMAAIQSTTGAQSTGGGSSGGAMIHLTQVMGKKICHDGDVSFYCDEKDDYMAAKEWHDKGLDQPLTPVAPDYSQPNPNSGPSCPNHGCAIPG